MKYSTRSAARLFHMLSPQFGEQAPAQAAAARPAVEPQDERHIRLGRGRCHEPEEQLTALFAVDGKVAAAHREIAGPAGQRGDGTESLRRRQSGYRRRGRSEVGEARRHCGDVPCLETIRPGKRELDSRSSKPSRMQIERVH